MVQKGENVQQGIQDRQKDLKLLQQEVEAIDRSADKTVEDSQNIFNELIRLLQERRHGVEQQIRSQQKAEVSRVKEHEEKLEQEIRELKELSGAEDRSQVLQDKPALSGLSGSTLSSSINIRPLKHFEDVTVAVSELRDQLQELVRDEWTNISLAVTEVDVLLSGPEPKTRAGFLKYSCDITLDPDTANGRLILSEGNRKVTRTSQRQSYPDHPDRFTDDTQVMTREGLTGRCYWELERSGTRVEVALTYKNISRTGWLESWFGCSDTSWILICQPKSFTFYHNKVETLVSRNGSSRVGVYLDHKAGLLSFYSISETMTLLHRVQTTFTQPLHVGLWVGSDATAELCEPKQTENVSGSVDKM